MNENLNKENFFDAIEEKYPAAFKHFSEWIDAYKVSVNWDKMFNGDQWIGIQMVRDEMVFEKSEAPKFHDLPYEMQVGIIFRYTCETFGQEHIALFLHEMMFLLTSTFAELERNQHGTGSN